MSADDQQDNCAKNPDANASSNSCSDQPREAQSPVTVSKKCIIAAFSCATVAFLLAGLFYFSRITNGDLFAFPQFLFLLALVTPCLMWQTLADNKLAKRISLWSSGIIWLAGIAVAFILGPASPFITVSDGLLLLGFVPLLYMWRFSIPWIIFGGFNLFIGMFLLLLSYLPDKPYFPEHLWAAKHHLAAYHPYMTWLLFGVVCTVFGLVRLLKNICKNTIKLVK